MEHDSRLTQAQLIAVDWSDMPDLASRLIQHVYAGLLERLPDGRYVVPPSGDDS